MILRQRITCRRPKNAIDWTVVITELGKLRLDSLDRLISRRHTIINGRGVIVRSNAGVIVRLIVSVVIVGVVVVRIIGKIILRKKSVI